MVKHEKAAGVTRAFLFKTQVWDSYMQLLQAQDLKNTVSLLRNLSHFSEPVIS